MLSLSKFNGSKQQAAGSSSFPSMVGIGLLLSMPSAILPSLAKGADSAGERPAAAAASTPGNQQQVTPEIMGVGVDLVEVGESAGRLQKLVMKFPDSCYSRSFMRQGATSTWTMVTSHPGAADQTAPWTGEIQIGRHEIVFKNDSGHQVWRLSSAILEAAIAKPDNTIVKLSELITPGTPALIHVGADWCGPCQRQMPALRQYATEGKVQILHVGFNQLPEAENGMKVGKLDEKTAEQLGIASIPYNVLVVDGKVETLPSVAPDGPDGPFPRIRALLHRIHDRLHNR